MNDTLPHTPEASPVAPEKVARRGIAGYQFVEAVHTVVTSLLLALIFRAFAVEPFMIPTGSMADGLMGAHASVVCPRCGWSFNLGLTLDEAPPSERIFCPNCHDRTNPPAPWRAGDRILVNKWIYALRDPVRWDVVVFRDPLDPAQIFIKRLAALPGEAIEIVDGDVYIRAPGASEFRIARKTPAAQSMLWTLVYSQDYAPSSTDFAWQPSAWVESPDDQLGGWSGQQSRVLRFEAIDATKRALRFDPRGSRHYFRDVNGYDGATDSAFVGDLRLTARVEWESGAGGLRWELQRDDDLFALEITSSSIRVLARRGQSEEVEWAKQERLLPQGGTIEIEFGHLDQRVYAHVDGVEIFASNDEFYDSAIGPRREFQRVAPPTVRLTAWNAKLAIRNFRIERDVHYTYEAGRTRRAYAGEPFRLDDGEYFMLGDNSLSSFDSRDWYKVGPHLAAAYRAGTYKLGTVQASQIVGQAFFVYLPGLLPIDERGHYRFLDVGRMRLIR